MQKIKTWLIKIDEQNEKKQDKEIIQEWILDDVEIYDVRKWLFKTVSESKLESILRKIDKVASPNSFYPVDPTSAINKMLNVDKISVEEVKKKSWNRSWSIYNERLTSTQPYEKKMYMLHRLFDDYELSFLHYTINKLYPNKTITPEKYPFFFYERNWEPVKILTLDLPQLLDEYWDVEFAERDVETWRLILNIPPDINVFLANNYIHRKRFFDYAWNDWIWPRLKSSFEMFKMRLWWMAMQWWLTNWYNLTVSTRVASMYNEDYRDFAWLNKLDKAIPINSNTSVDEYIQKLPTSDALEIYARIASWESDKVFSEIELKIQTRLSKQQRSWIIIETKEEAMWLKELNTKIER